MSDKNHGDDTGDDTVEIPNLRAQVPPNTREMADKGEQGLDGLNSVSAPERAWLEWYYSLSEEDNDVVKICGKRGVLATPANFEQMKAIVKNYDANDPGLNE